MGMMLVDLLVEELQHWLPFFNGKGASGRMNSHYEQNDIWEINGKAF